MIAKTFSEKCSITFGWKLTKKKDLKFSIFLLKKAYPGKFGSHI